MQIGKVQPPLHSSVAASLIRGYDGTFANLAQASPDNVPERTRPKLDLRGSPRFRPSVIDERGDGMVSSHNDEEEY